MSDVALPQHYPLYAVDPEESSIQAVIGWMLVPDPYSQDDEDDEMLVPLLVRLDSDEYIPHLPPTDRPVYLHTDEEQARHQAATFEDIRARTLRQALSPDGCDECPPDADPRELEHAIRKALRNAQSVEELSDIWQQYRVHWRDEYTEAGLRRRAELEQMKPSPMSREEVEILAESAGIALAR
jgi:hypothetical protein